MTVNEFVGAPAFIDFFISHPLISKALTNQITAITIVFISLYALYRFALHFAKTKKILPFAGRIIAVLAVCASFFAASNAARISVNPGLRNIIASVIYDKKSVREGLQKKYYFLVQIENELHGVVTTKAIYDMAMYTPGATFDYSIYAYYINGKTIIYRFLKPEFKVKALPGTLQ